MPKHIYNSASKVKCPICDFEFIPKYFHQEDVKYKFENKNESKGFKFFKKSNGHFKPLYAIRKSWITSCPECNYILRFVAEIGNKELANGSARILSRKQFKELGTKYKYTFSRYNKPYNEIIYYDKQNIKELKNQIIEKIEGLDLHDWGSIYIKWNNEEIQSFKFLIMFCSYFERHCELKNERTNVQDYYKKIDSLQISPQLKKLLTTTKRLQEKTIYEHYDLDESDAELIRKTFLKLMFELILNQLKDLDLDRIFYKEDVEEFQKHLYYVELRSLLTTYIDEKLSLQQELPNFIDSLLRSLKFPLISFHDKRFPKIKIKNPFQSNKIKNSFQFIKDKLKHKKQNTDNYK